MNNTLPLIDTKTNTSLVYKLYNIGDDPKFVCFEIAFINDNQNLQFKHAIFEDELPLLNKLLHLKLGEYYFAEPDIYFKIRRIHEDTIDISIHLDVNLIHGLPSDNQFETYEMTVNQQPFIQWVTFLIHHLEN